MRNLVLNVEKRECRMNKSVLNIGFCADEYIKLIKFKNFNDKFESKLIKDKYLLTSIVGIIEGNIYVHSDNLSWSIALLDKSFIINREQYVLTNICDTIKSNEKLYRFLKKYFDLWHSNKSRPEFYYDLFHKQHLEENFNNLLNIIENDAIKAYENYDLVTGDYLHKIYDSLINLFSMQKLKKLS